MDIDKLRNDYDGMIHFFPGGCALFSGFSRRVQYYGAFFTVDDVLTNDPPKNIYHNQYDDDDLPITAILIPY